MENKGFKTREKDLVSIVLTYFNLKDYVFGQLESILSQSYKNWELIIMDDCSTDGSEEMLKEWIGKNQDQKIKYIRNEKNLGLAKNFEKGLQFSSGEFVAVCDADDVWFPRKLEKQVNFLKNNNFNLVYSDLAVVDENLKTIKKSFIKSGLSFFSNQKNDYFEELINDNHITAPTILFKAELIEKIVPFSSHGLQDHWIAILASIDGKIGYLDQPTVYYRQHGSNMVGAEKFSISSLIFRKNKNFLEKHLELKENSLAYLADLRNVPWIGEKYKKIIDRKIEKMKNLAGCLEQFKSNDYKCRRCLKILWKLGGYREMMQIIYFRSMDQKRRMSSWFGKNILNNYFTLKIVKFFLANRFVANSTAYKKLVMRKAGKIAEENKEYRENIFIENSLTCNSRCVFCGHHNKTMAGIMSRELFEKIIDE